MPVNSPRPLRQGLRWMLAGFCFGSISAGAFLLLGGEFFFDIPLWAYLAFFPGFIAGYRAHNAGLNIAHSQVVGVLTVALAYAALAVLAWIVRYLLRRRRYAAASREDGTD